jgi:recombination associated protein RdgC
MSTLIKKAIVYAATLPQAHHLGMHLAERPYAPIGETELARISFVPHKISNELVTEFVGGYAFCMRLDEKILPKAIVRARAEERIAKIQSQTGARLSKVERLAIHDDTLVQLAKTALVKTAIITVYYREDKNLLIVPVTSKLLASHVIGTLIQVVGSVKTTTIHISDIKSGLTTRLKNHLNDNHEAFAVNEFLVGEQVELARGGQKVTYKLDALDAAKVGILERIESGFEVRALSLGYGGVEFKLNQDFTFKQIGFLDDIEHNPEDDGLYIWQQEASIQSMLVGNVVTSLCDLLGYEPPADEAEAGVNPELTTA